MSRLFLMLGSNELLFVWRSIQNVIVTSFLFLLPIDLAQASQEIWRYRSESDISFVRFTPKSDLICGTEDGNVFLLDSDTGKIVWKTGPFGPLDDKSHRWLSANRYGVIRTTSYGERVLILLSLETGEIRWDSRSKTTIRPTRYLSLEEPGLLLVCDKESQSKSGLIAIDLESGAMKWRHDRFFGHKPKVENVAVPFSGPNPLLDSDGNAILYITRDGPFSLDLSDGTILWRAEFLEGKEIEPNHPWILHDEVLYVPYEQSLAAIDSRSGDLIWSRDYGFDSRVLQLCMAQHGLVVGGEKFVSLLNPSTGKPKWPRAHKNFKNKTWFVDDEGSIYFATENSFVSIDLETGLKRDLAILEFLGRGERPLRIEKLGDDFLSYSPQNLLLLDASGKQKYHTHYPAAKDSLWKRIAATAIWNMFAMWEEYKASVTYESHFYLITSERLSDCDQEGISVVQIDKTTGKEIQRIWLDRKYKRFAMNASKGILYFSDKREISANKFNDPKY